VFFLAGEKKSLKSNVQQQHKLRTTTYKQGCKYGKPGFGITP